MKHRKFAAAFSILLFILSIGSLVYNGLNLGLYFTGGIQVEVHFNQPVDAQRIRNVLEQHGYANAVVSTT